MTAVAIGAWWSDTGRETSTHRSPGLQTNSPSSLSSVVCNTSPSLFPPNASLLQKLTLLVLRLVYSSNFFFPPSDRIERTGGDDGERSGAARCCAVPGSAHPDAGRAAAVAAVSDLLPLRVGAGAADQRGERIQPAPALLQPGRGHQDHRHGDLRGGGHRQDRARPVLQAGRRPRVRGPEPDHPGEQDKTSYSSH